MAELLCKSSFCIPSTRPSSSFSSKPCLYPISRYSVAPGNRFFGKKIFFDCRKGKVVDIITRSVPVKMSLSFPKAMKWWEKGIQSNMMEIDSAQVLVKSLLEAGDKLVIVDFFSPGCAGCRALHPKICQFAEKNTDVLFLQVNYEMHKSMCYSLNVHVLPFFRFYRGAHGRLCSFSCTNATIQKFKDALAKHTTERCSIWPAKGLEESELLALAANKDLCFDYTKKEEVLFTSPEIKEPVSAIQEFHLFPVPTSSTKESDDKVLTASGR